METVKANSNANLDEDGLFISILWGIKTILANYNILMRWRERF